MATKLYQTSSSSVPPHVLVIPESVAPNKVPEVVDEHVLVGFIGILTAPEQLSFAIGAVQVLEMVNVPVVEFPDA